MPDNIVKLGRKPGKIPTSILDGLKEDYSDYIVIGLTKEGEIAYSINADSHGTAFQLLLVAGGNVYKDQFGEA